MTELVSGTSIPSGPGQSWPRKLPFSALSPKRISFGGSEGPWTPPRPGGVMPVGFNGNLASSSQVVSGEGSPNRTPQDENISGNLCEPPLEGA